jgi:CDP-glucose 4,6-dehydratase
VRSSEEVRLMFEQSFRDRRVLVTGHTGFKGAWLCEWLLALGARVSGLSLPPPTQPALFEQLGLSGRMDHRLGDIRDAAVVREVIASVQPDFVFHLAAQPLVRLSYSQPVETYATNVLGTVHVLDALRALQHPCAAVLVTTDKCYENREWAHGYREEDPMGGFDPYSSSKGMAELAIAAYRRSFFAGRPVKIASARAGNVLGGGDWALDRIVPDCVRALHAGQPIGVRNPHATRPWQHVLDALSGYLRLAEALAQPPSSGASLDTAFNFGPGHDGNRTVRELVTGLLKHLPGTWEDQSDPNAPHEASFLQLSTDKAHALLGWSPVWTFAEAIRQTADWYRTARQAAGPLEIQALTRGQIEAYAASCGRPAV